MEAAQFGDPAALALKYYWGDRGEREAKPAQGSPLDEAALPVAGIRAASGVDLGDVKVEHRPELAKQGKQARAQGGQTIAVAEPELAQDATLLAHEAAHIVQQRGGATLQQAREGYASYRDSEGIVARDSSAPGSEPDPNEAPEGAADGAVEGAAGVQTEAGATVEDPGQAGAQPESRGQVEAPEGSDGAGAVEPAAQKPSPDLEAEADAAAAVFLGAAVAEQGQVLSSSRQSVLYQEGLRKKKATPS
jgi:hypothetical protein